MRLRGNSILENIIAGIILLILFVIASNTLNQLFKTSVNSRDIIFDNEIKELEYQLINNQKELPQSIVLRNNSAQFSKKGEKLKVEITKQQANTKTVCCIEEN